MRQKLYTLPIQNIAASRCGTWRAGARVRRKSVGIQVRNVAFKRSMYAVDDTQFDLARLHDRFGGVLTTVHDAPFD
jgi:hypothetical protein